MNNLKGAIYFDGLCLACTAEINHYRKKSGSDRFLFIDITAQDFKAEEHNLDPHQVHQFMHVRDPEGNLFIGVDAFRAIWKELTQYQFLYRLSGGKVARAALELGYRAFVKIRPYLPRKKTDCSKSPYCELKHD